MIKQLRHQLQALERAEGIKAASKSLFLGIDTIDTILGGGFARGTLHEIAAASEAHLPTANGFVLAIASLIHSPSPPHLTSFCSHAPSAQKRNKNRPSVIWIAENMTLAENGAPYGPGIDSFALSPERLITVVAAQRHDLFWAMEEALRCRAIDVVIGELRHGKIDMVTMRRLSLAASASGSLALLLRASLPNEASTAATRWIINAAPSEKIAHGIGGTQFAVQLIRNRRGPVGSWILEWSERNGRFQLTTNSQSMAAQTFKRPYRKIA